MRRHLLVTPLALLPALLLALLLTACGGGGEESDAGSAGGSGDGGSSAAEERGLPADFPLEDVPLLEGRVSQATSGEEAGEDGGFVVILQAEGTSDVVLGAAVSLLTDAGFTVTESVGGSGGGGFAGSTLTTDGFSVTITTFPNTGDEQTTLQYLVVAS